MNTFGQDLKVCSNLHFTEIHTNCSCSFILSLMHVISTNRIISFLKPKRLCLPLSQQVEILRAEERARLHQSQTHASHSVNGPSLTTHCKVEGHLLLN